MAFCILNLNLNATIPMNIDTLAEKWVFWKDFIFHDPTRSDH